MFAWCDAALGALTGGVGAVVGSEACGALAGAAGSAVSYGITAAQTGKFSWSGLAESRATGQADLSAAGSVLRSGKFRLRQRGEPGVVHRLPG